MSGIITFDARMLGASGIGTYIENLLAELRKLDHRLLFNFIGDYDKLHRIIGSSPRFEIKDADFPVFSIAEQLRLPGLAKGSGLFHAPFHNVPFRWKGKLLVTLFDVFHWDYPELIPNWKGKYYLRTVTKRIKKADFIITSSEFTRQRIIEHFGFPDENIAVIPLGVNLNHFSRRGTETVCAILEKYKLRPGNYMIYVGNMKPHKNIERLVEAYKIARSEGIRDYLVLAGKISGLRATVDVDSLISNEGVKYIGEVPNSDLPYLYSGARACTFISLYEGFGLPPLEAMACGCPVLCSNTTSLPEVVGNAAFTVNPNDIEKISEKIKKICLDLKLRKILIRKGLKQARFFSWEKTTLATIEIYKKLMEG